MKKLSILFILLLINSILIFSQSIHWGVNFGSLGNDNAGESARDFSGNMITSGYCGGQCYFGNDTISGGLFIAKFDSAGN